MARWLQMADRSFACQFSCSDPCNATHQPSRIPRPQARAAAGSPPAGARRAAQGQEGERRAGSKWLTGDLLANFPAPIHATPRISLHESRAPKRVALPEARQPGPAGQPRPEGRAARWLQMADRSFACQFSCSDPCNATHQPSRIPSPQARAAARSPPAGARRAAQGQEERAARWIQMADRSFACQFSCSNPCNATHQPSRIPRPQARAAARSPPAGTAGRPKARGASGALAPNG